MGRIVDLVVGCGLMAAGAFVAYWGVIALDMGGDSGTNDHPYRGWGILTLLAGISLAVAGVVWVRLRSRPR